MDPLNIEAISGMKAALSTFLPESHPPEHAPDISITKAKITPAGISGIIGISTDPPGDIIGRLVAASVAITVRPSQFDDYVNALIACGEGELRQAGILKLAMQKSGGRSQSSERRREINVDILFEYRKYPEEGGDVIKETPINLELNGVS